jgi:hypothetical protein
LTPLRTSRWGMLTTRHSTPLALCTVVPETVVRVSLAGMAQEHYSTGQCLCKSTSSLDRMLC